MVINEPINFKPDKPSILFLHGFASNHKVWKTSCDRLARHFNCITVDLFHQPRVPDGRPLVRVHELAEEITTFLYQRRYGSLTICGHSYGGQIAIHVAAQQPALIEQLVLVAPSGIEHYSAMEQMMAQPAIAYIAHHLQASQTDYLRYAFQQFDGNARQLASELLQDYFAATAPYTETVNQYVLQEIMATTSHQLLHKISKPALVVFGEMDMLIPNLLWHPMHSTRIVASSAANLLPFGSYKLLSNAGHMVMYEQPEVFCELLKKFAYSSSVIQPNLQ